MELRDPNDWKPLNVSFLQRFRLNTYDWEKLWYVRFKCLSKVIPRFLSDDLILLMEGWCKGSPQRSCQTQTVSVWDIQLVNGSERLPEVAVEVVCLTAVHHLQWQKMLLKLFSRIGYVMKIELVQGWSPEGLHLNLYVHFRIRIITNMRAVSQIPTQFINQNGMINGVTCCRSSGNEIKYFPSA